MEGTEVSLLQKASMVQNTGVSHLGEVFQTVGSTEATASANGMGAWGGHHRNPPQSTFRDVRNT